MTDREMDDSVAKIVVRHMPDILRDVTVWLPPPQSTVRGTIDIADFQAIVRETISTYRSVVCLDKD